MCVRQLICTAVDWLGGIIQNTNLGFVTERLSMSEEILIAVHGEKGWRRAFQVEVQLGTGSLTHI